MRKKRVFYTKPSINNLDTFFKFSVDEILATLKIYLRFNMNKVSILFKRRELFPFLQFHESEVELLLINLFDLNKAYLPGKIRIQPRLFIKFLLTSTLTASVNLVNFKAKPLKALSVCEADTHSEQSRTKRFTL